MLFRSSEANAVYTQITGSNPNTWVGLSNLAGSYKVVTNEPNSYLPWGASQPSGGTQCAYLLSTAQYASDVCAVLHTFVCECDGFPDNPANY